MSLCIYVIGAEIGGGALASGRPNAKVQGRSLGVAEACSGGGVPCNAQLGQGASSGAFARPASPHTRRQPGVRDELQRQPLM